MKFSKHILIVFAFFLITCSSSGKEHQKKTNACKCDEAFAGMIEKLESNYIGFKQMNSLEANEDYESRKKDYHERSAKVLPENCAEFLDDFLDYFNDGHLHVLERPSYSESELIQFKDFLNNSKIKKDSLTEQLLDKNKQVVKKSKDIIIGNWTDGVSTFVVIKNDNKYLAYILESTKEDVSAGELKAIFTAKDQGYVGKYYSYNYSPIYIKGNVCKEGQLLRAGHVFWKRVDTSFSLSSDKTNKLFDPKLDILSTKTSLLTIPSFNLDFESFKDFIEKNELYIKNSRNLIIDIRGNRGGNGVYFPLIELFATSNLHSNQGLVLASNDNLAYFQKKTEYSKKVYKPVVERISKENGEIVDGPFYPEKRFNIRENLIENVAILTDHGCASAAESFILHSKRASSKVKTFGSPTAGMIDYTSVNSLLLNSGKQNIYFAYPTSTIHKLIPKHGFNQTGIIPDTPIGNEEEDKVQYILNRFQERK